MSPSEAMAAQKPSTSIQNIPHKNKRRKAQALIKMPCAGEVKSTGKKIY